MPILIHGGRGLPPIADGLHALVDRYPEATLIIAHAGIADLAALAGHLAGRKGVLFDTSTWSPVDLLDFYRQVPPEQVVYASDYPYGQQPASILIALKTARLAGCDDDQLRAMLGGTANALADGLPLPEPTSPLGERAALAAAAARAHPPVPLDGDAAPLDAPAGHRRRARASRSTRAPSGTVTWRPVDRIRELLVAARDLWADAARDRGRGRPARRDAARRFD